MQLVSLERVFIDLILASNQRGLQNVSLMSLEFVQKKSKWYVYY